MSTNDENIKYGIEETDLTFKDHHHEIHKSCATNMCKILATEVSDQQLESSNSLNGLDSTINYFYSLFFDDDLSSTKPNDQIVESENLVASKNLDDEVKNEDDEVDNEAQNTSGDSIQSLNPVKSVGLNTIPDTLCLNHLDDECKIERAKAIAQYSLENDGNLKPVQHKGDDLLGEGLHSKVYKHKFNNVQMAVKWVKKEKLTDFKQLPFNTEYKNITSIHHKNLLKIYNYNDKTNMVFTEYCDSFIGLSEYIKKTSKEDRMRNAVDILRGILSGLHELHSHNVLHRDIKADNVIIDSNDLTPKICDFDFAIKLAEDKSVATGIFGTATHMAPEVFDDTKEYSFSADIYSFGCLVIEFLTGQRPWAHLNYPEQICHQLYQLKQLPLNPELDNSACDFIKKCTSFEPDERYTAKDLLNHSFLKKSC